jgi:hypothetical protein
MMLATYRSLREMEKLTNRPKLPTIPTPKAGIERHRVIAAYQPRKRRKRRPKPENSESPLAFVTDVLESMTRGKRGPTARELTQLLNNLKANDAQARAKAARVLLGQMTIRVKSKKYPELVPLAAELARSLPDAASRATCVTVLTSITPDGPTPQWLVDALNDAESDVQGTALSAVFWFSSPVLIAPISRIIAGATKMEIVAQAAEALAQIADARVVTELSALLERSDLSGTFAHVDVRQQEDCYARIMLGLARYGEAAIPILLKYLSHSDPCRRLAAIVALRAIGDLTTREAVAKLKKDPVDSVQKQAELCDRIWGSGLLETHTLA